MTQTIRDEIKQTRPFRSPAEEAMTNLARTGRLVSDAGDLLFKEFGLSSAQYNVLRILRGAGSEGLGRNEIRDRLITRMPDVTRLLERMAEAGLVRRERDTEDRRCVPTYITPRGLALLDQIDAPLTALQQQLFGHLSTAQLQTLSELLTLVRQRS